MYACRQVCTCIIRMYVCMYVYMYTCMYASISIVTCILHKGYYRILYLWDAYNALSLE